MRLLLNEVVGRVGIEPTTKEFTFVLFSQLRGLYHHPIGMSDARAGY